MHWLMVKSNQFFFIVFGSFKVISVSNFYNFFDFLKTLKQINTLKFVDKKVTANLLTAHSE